jgi:hypothetical protein
MGSRQMEFGQVVIKLCIQPPGGCMAAGTIGGEVSGSVIRIRSAFKVLSMTAVAVGRSARITPRNVALPAILGCVGSRQRKLCCRVIEFYTGPGVRVVASQAIVTESGLCVAGIFGRAEVLRVTTETVFGGSRESIADVALNASERSVRPRQRECGVLRVVKPGARPGVHVVAILAGQRQSRRLMVRRPGRLILTHVARNAGGAEADKLADGRSLVAGIAIGGGMRTDERETVQVIPDGMNRKLPSPNAVARFAIGAELTAVDVCVAVLADFGSVGKNEFDVTLPASH